ncbi:XylR N-terminal domain-containing protein [Neobacillus sp. DY30]|uniref:XylR N-terminal domain-containing protein n=1 Tax=Neobacillus sp. DY30 TaxID=3047871 RepID=UPI0024BF6DBE|nr:XylR N-terminal domain-containing protein [Neobacillus sp. DY30]WHY03231.1 XylR N-terminal domain-containing protein [Neobacillus sp. DY30]
MSFKQIHIKNAFELSKEKVVNEFYERIITIPIEARTNLKNELITMIGEERTRGVFIRYGWHCGVSDAEKAMSLEWDDQIDLALAGPKFHMLHGYLDKVEIMEMSFDEQNKCNFIEVLWVNTFEASQYLKAKGLSKEPVCHNLCGYASGYLSKVLQQPILVKEVECRAMGHEQCKCICMPIEKWGEEITSDLSYYQANSMIQELDEVTAKLKIERDHLSKASDIHRQLIGELLSNQGIQKVADILFETTGLTVFIEDEYNQIIVKSGNLQEHLTLQTYRDSTTTFVRYSEKLSLLRTPIYYGQQIKGYCSFVYTGENQPNELDYMIIENAAITASLILFNESIKINTEQTIKRSFLNDILEGRLAKEEMYKIAYYLKFNPSSTYWMLTLERFVNESNIENELASNEEMIGHIHQFLKERNINSIVSQKLNKIIILMEYPTFEKIHLSQSSFIDQMLKHCSRRFPKYRIAVGVSSVIQEFTQTVTLYNETLAALRATNHRKNVYYFEELGIESVLFQLQDDLLIERFVNQHLGKLLEADSDDFELIRTLFAYIDNGSSINNTAKELSMSISGLRYRLAKISEILNHDLNDTQYAFTLYLAINILKAKGKIEI